MRIVQHSVGMGSKLPTKARPASNFNMCVLEVGDVKDVGF